MRGKKSIKNIAITFGIVLFISAFVLPFSYPDIEYWSVIKIAAIIVVASVLWVDCKAEKSGRNEDRNIAIKTYKLIILGITAAASFVASIEILPFYEQAKTLRGDLVLILALFTFADEYKRYFFQKE